MKISPLELAKKTPMTNCGECGFPTCFAFAAAVVKVSEDYSKCKYLDTTGLELPDQKKGEMEDILKEHDLALIEHLKSKIALIDFSQIAPAIGASFNSENDTISFKYLGAEVTVSKNQLLLDGMEPVDPRDQILLYNYIHFKGGKIPQGEWIGMESMPNSISKVRTLSVYSEKPISSLFSSQAPGNIIKICQRIDGTPVSDCNADIAITFQVLPMLPIQVHFWSEDADEGFEAKVKILFDQHVLEFLDIESLVFTAERLAEKLQELISP